MGDRIRIAENYLYNFERVLQEKNKVFNNEEKITLRVEGKNERKSPKARTANGSNTLELKVIDSEKTSRRGSKRSKSSNPNPNPNPDQKSNASSKRQQHKRIK